MLRSQSKKEMTYHDRLRVIYLKRTLIHHINWLMDQNEVVHAAEIYNSLSFDEQSALMMAPTKLAQIGIDPVFTRQRLDYMKGAGGEYQPMPWLDALRAAGNIGDPNAT